MTDYNKCDTTTTTTTEQADSGLETWYKKHGLAPQRGESLGTSDSDTVTLSRTVFEQMFTDTENTNKRAMMAEMKVSNVEDAFGDLIQWHTDAIIRTMKRSQTDGLHVAADFEELVENLKDFGAIEGTNEETLSQIDEIRSELGRIEDMAGTVKQGLDDAAYELQQVYDPAGDLVSEIEGLRYTFDQLEVN